MQDLIKQNEKDAEEKKEDEKKIDKTGVTGLMRKNTILK